MEKILISAGLTLGILGMAGCGSKALKGNISGLQRRNAVRTGASMVSLLDTGCTRISNGSASGYLRTIGPD